jgi:hypothetical protein
MIKGQSHEIFDPQFLLSNHLHSNPDTWASNVASYSSRHSIRKLAKSTFADFFFAKEHSQFKDFCQYNFNNMSMFMCIFVFAEDCL